MVFLIHQRPLAGDTPASVFWLMEGPAFPCALFLNTYFDRQKCIQDNRKRKVRIPKFASKAYKERGNQNLVCQNTSKWYTRKRKIGFSSAKIHLKWYTNKNQIKSCLQKQVKMLYKRTKKYNLVYHLY